LNLDDDTEDEYDFMDDDSNDENGQARRINPKLKYMKTLQHVADRTVSQVLIELDDIEAVCCLFAQSDVDETDASPSTKKVLTRIQS
jgi:hypothetical protein